MALTAWVNGEFLPLERATIHIEDRGFQFADGVYEVIACFGGTFLEMDAHLKRLRFSADAIGITLPFDAARLRALIEETYRRNPFENAMLYIQVTRGCAPRAHHISETLQPTLVITARDLPIPSPAKVQAGVRAITLPDIRWKRCDIKSIALLASVLGKRQAAAAGADEAFWLDEAGYLLEGCATNCFAVIDGRLVTHPLDHQVLGGITRNLLLQIATREGIAVEERPWKLSEANLTECMMSSTTSAVMPVCEIDGRAIGDGRPGPVANRLRQLMLAEFKAMQAAG